MQDQAPRIIGAHLALHTNLLTRASTIAREHKWQDLRVRPLVHARGNHPKGHGSRAPATASLWRAMEEVNTQVRFRVSVSHSYITTVLGVLPHGKRLVSDPWWNAGLWRRQNGLTWAISNWSYLAYLWSQDNSYFSSSCHYHLEIIIQSIKPTAKRLSYIIHDSFISRDPHMLTTRNPHLSANGSFETCYRVPEEDKSRNSGRWWQKEKQSRCAGLVQV